MLDVEREDHGRNRRGCTPGSFPFNNNTLVHKRHQSGNESGTSRCILTGTEISREPCFGKSPKHYFPILTGTEKVRNLVFVFRLVWKKSGTLSFYFDRYRQLNSLDMKCGSMHTEVNVSAPKLRSRRQDECSREGATVCAVACATNSNTAQ